MAQAYLGCHTAIHRMHALNRLLDGLAHAAQEKTLEHA
jgi:hypothetical protein